MGTRGIIGIRIDGADKLTYNHSDSYPDGAGLDTYKAVRDTIMKDLETYKGLARAMKLVDDDKSPPTPEEIAALEKFHNSTVSSGEKTEWYALLRNAQGEILKNLECGYMMEYGSFIMESLHCEWGYIINFDDLVFETYVGFQSKAHTKGRYGKLVKAEKKKTTAMRMTGDARALEKFYPCALVHTQQMTPKMPEPGEWLKKINDLTSKEA